MTASPPQAKPPRRPLLNGQRTMLTGLVALIACLLAAWLWWRPVWDFTQEMWQVVQDREAFRLRVEDWGPWAPAAFVVFQVFQVLISPFPGELVLLASGYVFGWLPSLVYSILGLSLGSWLNFALARAIGRPLVERVIPPQYLSRIAFLMERQGMVASFIFFVVPGLPKDYLCYALGLSPMGWRVFLLVSSVGRVPSTMLLSMQGAAVYQEDYWGFLWLGLANLAFILPVVIWREPIYQWLYHLEKGRGPLGNGSPPPREAAGDGLGGVDSPSNGNERVQDAANPSSPEPR